MQNGKKVKKSQYISHHHLYNPPSGYTHKHTPLYLYIQGFTHLKPNQKPMADEAQYDSSTNKRKYADDIATPPSTGRVTGFSSGPITSQSPDSTAPSYNSVPPPADAFLIAKQKAMELAAKYTANAPPEAETKRPRFENGAEYEANKSFGSGFSSAPNGLSLRFRVSIFFRFDNFFQFRFVYCYELFICAFV